MVFGGRAFRRGSGHEDRALMKGTPHDRDP